MALAHDIKLIILFGSRAKGTAGPRSDTDIAVLADHPLNLEEKAEIGTGVVRELGVSEDALDIVDLWDAPPLLQHQIANHGRLLRGDPSDFLRFKVLAWKRYQDTAKFRRAREKALVNRYGQRSHSQKD